MCRTDETHSLGTDAVVDCEQSDPLSDNGRFPVRRGDRSRSIAGLRTVGGPDAPNLALALLDLSENGARFLLTSEVKTNWQAEVTFHLSGQARSVRLQSRIVWCTPAPDASGYQAGIKFRQRLPLSLLQAVLAELSVA